MAPMGGAPRTLQLPSGEIDIFWRGKVRQSVWYAQITPDQRVSRPRRLGGQVSGEPWPVQAAGVEAVLFRGPRGQLWEVLRTGRTWGAPTRVATTSGRTLY